MIGHRVRVFLVGMVVVSSAHAGEVDAFQNPIESTEVGEDRWEFRGSIYAPIVGLDGTTRVGTNILPVDVSFSDIADNLDGGAVIAFDARRGRFSFVGDFIWLKLSTSAVPNPSAYTGTTLQQTVASAALGYELYEDHCWTLDALVGGAYTGLKVDADLTVFPPAGGPTTTYLSETESWVDPFVGVRFRYRAGERWRFFGRLDYGGFGVASDTYFQGILGGGYLLNDSVGIYAAYRHLIVDYSKSRFAYDVETSGPQVGVVFTF